jgi:hypothetical protein
VGEWAVLEGGLAVEHGRVVRDGNVIDPAVPDDAAVYFPASEFRGPSGIEQFLRTPRGRKRKTDPLYHAFGRGGKHSPSCRQAFRNAVEYRNKVYNKEKNPPPNKEFGGGTLI